MDEASEAMALSERDEPGSAPDEPTPGGTEADQSQGAEPAAVKETAPPECEGLPLPSESEEKCERSLDTAPEKMELAANEPFVDGSPPYEGGVRGGFALARQQPPPHPLLGKEGVHWPNDVVRPENEAISDRLERIIESVLFAASAPVSLRRLVEILDGPTSKEVLLAVRRLLQEYAPGRHGIHLREVAGGYQFRTARENAEWVRAVFREKPARLGRAALETLAIVAYKQPVTRVEIEAVRGVDVDGVLSTLLSRRLIKIEGRKEAVGRPLLYGTTAEFLEVFGLKDLSELPSLKELGPAPDTDDEATIPNTEQQTAAANEAVEGTADVAPDPGTSTAAAPAEAPQPSGDLVAAESGGVDSSGSGAPEWPGGDRTGDEGGPADGSDHG